MSRARPLPAPAAVLLLWCLVMLVMASVELVEFGRTRPSQVSQSAGHAETARDW
ncbi:hypothetical protein K440DRAFT_621559 [Wilcoxina mikolae CBS 423.85]|nr:hypothetical protein K440DRAFT_621559 [Wilcoxina mikolae CBS 423.85]